MNRAIPATAPEEPPAGGAEGSAVRLTPAASGLGRKALAGWSEALRAEALRAEGAEAASVFSPGTALPGSCADARFGRTVVVRPEGVAAAGRWDAEIVPADDAWPARVAAGAWLPMGGGVWAAVSDATGEAALSGAVGMPPELVAPVGAAEPVSPEPPASGAGRAEPPEALLAVEPDSGLAVPAPPLTLLDVLPPGDVPAPFPVSPMDEPVDAVGPMTSSGAAMVALQFALASLQTATIL